MWRDRSVPREEQMHRCGGLREQGTAGQGSCQLLPFYLCLKLKVSQGRPFLSLPFPGKKVRLHVMERGGVTGGSGGGGGGGFYTLWVHWGGWDHAEKTGLSFGTFACSRSFRGSKGPIFFSKRWTRRAKNSDGKN